MAGNYKSDKLTHLQKIIEVENYDAMEKMKVKPSATWHFKHRPYEHVERVDQDASNVVSNGW